MCDRHCNVHHVSHLSRPPRCEREVASSHELDLQPREFNLLVFDQDVHWTDAHGNVYPIACMDVVDRDALAEWLYRNAVHFYTHVLAREITSMLRTAPGTLPPMIYQPPERWMRETSLMRALEGHDEERPP